MKSIIFAILLFFCAAIPGTAEVHCTDDAGQTISLIKPATRIIPLYAAVGEILVELGLHDSIVAKTNNDQASGDVPKIGTHMRPNIELIAAVKPDLVIQVEGREEAAELAEKIQTLGIPVARFRITSFDELFSCINRLASLTAKEEQAATMIAGLQSRLQKARGQQGTPPRIFYEVRYPNLLGAGSGNMVNEIIQAAGGQNVLEGYPDKLVRLSEEALMALAPDMYLYQEGAMNKNPISPLDREHFSTLPAVKNKHVFMVDESLFSRPGPKSVEAVEQLASIIRAWQSSQSAE